MAKSKEVAYKPLQSNTSIPNYTQQTINQIPTYEDRGVKYQGKYKIQQTESRYELKAQETRFYTLGIGAGAPGSHLFPRDRPQTKFYCTKMIIQHHGPTTFSLALARISLADVIGTNGSIKFYYFPIHTEPDTIIIDFRDSPRKFEGEQFDLYTQYGFGAAEFLVIQLFGWEEQP